MKKSALLIFVFTSSLVLAQTNQAPTNKLLNPEFWKSTPSLEEVKKEITVGSSASEMNAIDFDATSLAINNNAGTEVIGYLLQQEGNSVDKVTNHMRTYLHWAAARGNTSTVKLLIEKGSNVNATDSHGDTPLQFAANSGMVQPAIYELFRQAGVDLKQRNKYGATYMMLGVSYDDKLALTGFLAEMGLSVHDTDNSGATVFDYAARTGNIEVMRSLRSTGVKATDAALLMAARGTRRATSGVEVYSYLIEELNLNPKVTDEDGNTLLHLVARKANQLPVVSYLLSKGLNPNTLSSEGSNVLMAATGGSDSGLIHLLLQLTPDINLKNNKDESALTSAVNSGSAEITEILLSKGADVRLRDLKGNHLGYYLVQSYRPARGGITSPADDFSKKMKLLISSGLDIVQPMADKNTLYHIAAQKADPALFSKLSELAIDINAKNEEEMTVLHKIALTAHDNKLLKFLLEQGADKTITTEFGETAYDLAESNDYLTATKTDITFLK